MRTFRTIFIDNDAPEYRILLNDCPYKVGNKVNMTFFLDEEKINALEKNIGIKDNINCFYIVDSVTTFGVYLTYIEDKKEFVRRYPITNVSPLCRDLVHLFSYGVYFLSNNMSDLSTCIISIMENLEKYGNVKGLIPVDKKKCKDNIFITIPQKYYNNWFAKAKQVFVKYLARKFNLLSYEQGSSNTGENVVNIQRTIIYDAIYKKKLSEVDALIYATNRAVRAVENTMKVINEKSCYDTLVPLNDYMKDHLTKLDKLVQSLIRNNDEFEGVELLEIIRRLVMYYPQIAKKLFKHDDFNEFMRVDTYFFSKIDELLRAGNQGNIICMGIFLYNFVEDRDFWSVRIKNNISVMIAQSNLLLIGAFISYSDNVITNNRSFFNFDIGEYVMKEVDGPGRKVENMIDLINFLFLMTPAYHRVFENLDYIVFFSYFDFLKRKCMSKNVDTISDYMIKNGVKEKSLPFYICLFKEKNFRKCVIEVFESTNIKNDVQFMFDKFHDIESWNLNDWSKIVEKLLIKIVPPSPQPSISKLLKYEYYSDIIKDLQCCGSGDKECRDILYTCQNARVFCNKMKSDTWNWTNITKFCPSEDNNRCWFYFHIDFWTLQLSKACNCTNEQQETKKECEELANFIATVDANTTDLDKSYSGWLEKTICNKKDDFRNNFQKCCDNCLKCPDDLLRFCSKKFEIFLGRLKIETSFVKERMKEFFAKPIDLNPSCDMFQ